MSLLPEMRNGQELTFGIFGGFTMMMRLRGSCELAILNEYEFAVINGFF